MNETHARPLAAVVEKPRDQELRIGRSIGTQRRDHGQAVAPIRHVHSIEEPQLSRTKPAGKVLPLRNRDPGAHVRPGPPELGGPPSRHAAN